MEQLDVMGSAQTAFGPMLRDWRRRRSFSQLALSAEAEISQRHLSFIESGRSAPSREMVLRLAETLAVPLRERNALLTAAGFAPVYRERAPDDPALATAMTAVSSVLRGYEPFPALAVDRHWTMLDGNTAIARLVAGADPALLEPPINVLRLSLHPQGLAHRILNYREWRTHIIARLEAQIRNSADPALVALRAELKAYPVPVGAWPSRPIDAVAMAAIAVPLWIRVDGEVLSFLSTTMVFGTALDISLSELAVEAFFPADEETAARLRATLSATDRSSIPERIGS